MSKVQAKYQKIINELAYKYGIHLNYSHKGEYDTDPFPNYYWWSIQEDREVLIPRPKNIYKFLVALHEFGHIVTRGHNVSYIDEWKAEMWALKTAKKYGFTRTTHYEKYAAKYILKYINLAIKKGELTKKQVRPEIRKWMRERGVTI